MLSNWTIIKYINLRKWKFSYEVCESCILWKIENWKCPLCRRWRCKCWWMTWLTTWHRQWSNVEITRMWWVQAVMYICSLCVYEYAWGWVGVCRCVCVGEWEYGWVITYMLTSIFLLWPSSLTRSWHTTSQWLWRGWLNWAGEWDGHHSIVYLLRAYVCTNGLLFLWLYLALLTTTRRTSLYCMHHHM